MEKRDETSSIGKPPYTCSNPNCGNVFSIPKVIKYYVCPLCQTLVEMSAAGDSVVNEEYAPVEEPQAKTAITKTVHDSAQVHLSLRPKSIQSESVEPKSVEPKSVEPKSVEPKSVEPKSVEPTIVEGRATEPEGLAHETSRTKPQQQVPEVRITDKQENMSSDQVCKYYLGYLSQRDKGEGIPATCVECNRSIDCMLSEYYKSEDTVAEIKKWYRPKL